MEGHWILLLALPPWSWCMLFFAPSCMSLISCLPQFVIGFLTILTSGLQYLIKSINYKKDLERIELIVAKAKSAAWGPKMVPLPGKRKVRVNLGEARDENGEVTGSKFLDMIVEGSDVFLVRTTT